MQYVTRQKDMLDLICLKQYGTHDGGVVEKVIEANPQLYLQPAILPDGLTLELPVIEVTRAAAPVRLWD